MFKISVVIRIFAYGSFVAEEERKARRKEELFRETVLPREHSQLRRLFAGISKAVSLEVIIPSRVEGVVSSAITPTVILLYFAAHLFSSLLANQGNILCPLFARLLAKCGTIAPRGIVSFVSFEKALA